MCVLAGRIFSFERVGGAGVWPWRARRTGEDGVGDGVACRDIVEGVLGIAKRPPLRGGRPAVGGRVGLVDRDRGRAGLRPAVLV